MNVEKYALTTQTYGVPFICTMKKYTRTKGRANREIDDDNAPGSILLLGHGSGFRESHQCESNMNTTLLIMPVS